MGKSDVSSIIEVKLKGNDVLPPILASFQHGNLPENAPNLKCSVACNKRTGKRDFTVEIENSNVIYRGTEDEVRNPGKTFIAIRNKINNKVRLFDASSILFSPIIKEAKKLKINLNKSSNDLTLLKKSFGSKTQRRQAELLERSKTDGDALAENIRLAVANVEVVNVPPSEATNPLMCPPCNRKASKVEDVYQLEDIITQDELNSMKEKALEVIENADNIDKKEYTIFFQENFLQILGNRDNRLERIEVLLYIDCILKFFNDPFKSQSMLAHTCPYSQMITKKIRQDFTEESTSKRLRPPKLKNKATCQIIVLCFLLFNFKFDLKTIINSSKESITRLIMLSRALGATTPLKNSTIIELKLPLSAPYVALGSKKKTKR